MSSRRGFADVRRLPARADTPEEVAALIGFLCGDGAGYINGRVIGVDGGMS